MESANSRSSCIISSRLTPEQCQKHRWISKVRRPSSAKKELDKANLRQYVIRRRWHAALHTVKALKRMGAELTVNHLSESNQSLTRSKSSVNYATTENSLFNNLNHSKSSNDIENLLEPVYRPSLETVKESDHVQSKTEKGTLINNFCNVGSVSLKKTDTSKDNLQTKSSNSCTESVTSSQKFFIVTENPLITDVKFKQPESRTPIATTTSRNFSVSSPQNALKAVKQSDDISLISLSTFENMSKNESATFPLNNEKSSKTPTSKHQLSTEVLSKAPTSKHQMSTKVVNVTAKSPVWTTKTLGPSLASRAAKWINQPTNMQEATRTYSESLLVNQILDQFNGVQGLASIYSRPPPKKRK
ncbi:hypothetical protein SK128_000922, partial [Halocaridina rubra]